MVIPRLKVSPPRAMTLSSTPLAISRSFLTLSTELSDVSSFSAFSFGVHPFPQVLGMPGVHCAVRLLGTAR